MLLLVSVPLPLNCEVRELVCLAYQGIITTIIGLVCTCVQWVETLKTLQEWCGTSTLHQQYTYRMLYQCRRHSLVIP